MKNLVIRFEKVTLQSVEHKHHLITKFQIRLISNSLKQVLRKQHSSCFFFTLHVYMYYIHTFLGIQRVRMSDLRIAYSRIGFVFSRITLSNFLWNLQIKTSLLLELLYPAKPRSFCLHFKFDNLLISYSKNC